MYTNVPTWVTRNSYQAEKKLDFTKKNQEYVGVHIGSVLTLKINITNDKQHNIQHCTFTNQRPQSYLLGFCWITKLRFANSQVRVHLINSHEAKVITNKSKCAFHVLRPFPFSE